jgi:hypothetical protein
MQMLFDICGWSGVYQHINFLGMYDFSFKNALNIQEMLNIIERCFEEELLKSK